VILLYPQELDSIVLTGKELVSLAVGQIVRCKIHMNVLVLTIEQVTCRFHLKMKSKEKMD
jgi:hypothetical protein